MKNRLSLPTTIIIFLVTIFVVIGTRWLLEEKLGLAEWISWIITLVILFIAYEFVSRLIPEKSDAPITYFLKLSKRDKVVFLVGILAMCIVVVIGKSLHSDSGWVNLLFLVLGLLAWRLIYQFFGSDEMMKM
jgi:type IV secretory pathway VirB2 component (pilin)